MLYRKKIQSAKPALAILAGCKRNKNDVAVPAFTNDELAPFVVDWNIATGLHPTFCHITDLCYKHLLLSIPYRNNNGYTANTKAVDFESKNTAPVSKDSIFRTTIPAGKDIDAAIKEKSRHSLFAPDVKDCCTLINSYYDTAVVADGKLKE